MCGEQPTVEGHEDPPLNIKRLVVTWVRYGKSRVEKN